MEFASTPATSTAITTTKTSIETVGNATGTGFSDETCQRNSKVNSSESGKIFNDLPPQPVGREFVRQFYTIMSKEPQQLYRFYSADSTLTFGNNSVIVGQDRIRKSIEKRELIKNTCHARILKIDAQPTLGNGVVVQVIGELSNNLKPLRPFTQTFVLSPQVPKNLYIYNEIFRYQDEFYPNMSIKFKTMAKQPLAAGDFKSSTSDMFLTVSMPSLPITHEMEGTSAKGKETGLVKTEEEVASSSMSANKIFQQIAADNANPLFESKSSQSISMQPQPDSDLWLGDSKATYGPAAAMTYANVFKSSSGQFKPTPPTDTLPELLSCEISTNYIPSATFTSSKPNSPIIPPFCSKNRSEKNSGAALLRKGDPEIERIVDRSTNGPVANSSPLQQTRRVKLPRERYDDNLQLFLGNLPLNASVATLTKMFDKYGTILELRVLSKPVQPGTKRPPNYGFLTYDSVEAVQRCLEDRPFYFPENCRNGTRLNVRPKNGEESQSSSFIAPNPNSDVQSGAESNTGYAEKTSERRQNRRERFKDANSRVNNKNANSYPNQGGERQTILSGNWPKLSEKSSNISGNQNKEP